LGHSLLSQLAPVPNFVGCYPNSEHWKIIILGFSMACGGGKTGEKNSIRL
jgi:hypothetical protein